MNYEYNKYLTPQNQSVELRLKVKINFCSPWFENGSGSSPVKSMCNSRNRWSVTLVGNPATPYSNTQISQ